MNQPDPPHPRTRAISGKLVILGILAVALLAAGTSWLFRYNATHRAAEFWGPVGARLIRDAAQVSLNKVFLSSVSKTCDLSHAPGITHLRNALLEDRSFQWEQMREAEPTHDKWMLTFRDPPRGEKLSIFFTTDCRSALVGQGGAKRRMISTEPIAAGLLEVFAEHLPETEVPAR